MGTHSTLRICPLVFMFCSAVIAEGEPATATVECIEITQTIQNFERHVPLLCGKESVARVYVSWSGDAVIGASGQLVLTDSATSTVHAPISSENEIILDPEKTLGLEEKRASIGSSLYFMLPPNQTKGSVSVRLANLTANDGSDIPFGVDNKCSTDFRFHRAPPMRIRVVGFKYQYPPHNLTAEPRAEDYELFTSWLQRTFPISELSTSYHKVLSNTPWPFECEDVNEQLSSIRVNEVLNGVDSRTRYYGMVRSTGGNQMRGCVSGIPDTPDVEVVASGPAGVPPWLHWDQDASMGDWYGAHEVAHMLGRRHVGSCGATDDDANYPFDGGKLSDLASRYVGFDTGEDTYSIAPTVLPGLVWHDTMSYCARQWMSKYTYLGLMQRLEAEDALITEDVPTGGCPIYMPDEADSPITPSAETPSPDLSGTSNVLHVTAKLNLSDRSGSIISLQMLKQGIVSPEPRQGPTKLRFSNELGLDEEVFVTLRESTDRPVSIDRMALISSTVPFPTGATRIELILDNNPIDTRKASANPPRINRVRLLAGLGNSSAVVIWEAEDDDGDELRYTVLMSTDMGATWVALAVGIREDRIEIDSDPIPQSGARFRIFVSDGFHTSETNSDPLTPI